VNHPAFVGFGKYILPRDDNTYYYDTPLNNVRLLLPYHSHVDPDIVVGAINHMIDEINDGKTIFYDFYTFCLAQWPSATRTAPDSNHKANE
jgi:hypothetical protein